MCAMHGLCHHLTADFCLHSMKSSVMHCCLVSFIFLIIILFSHLYSSAEDMFYNRLDFATLLWPHKSNISSVIQTCFFSFSFLFFFFFLVSLAQLPSIQSLKQHLQMSLPIFQ